MNIFLHTAIFAILAARNVNCDGIVVPVKYVPQGRLLEDYNLDKHPRIGEYVIDVKIGQSGTYLPVFFDTDLFASFYGDIFATNPS